MKASLRNEKVLTNYLKKQLGELVFKQKRIDEDLISKNANIKEIDEDKKQTKLQIKKVNKKLESQGIVLRDLKRWDFFFFTLA